MKYHLRLFGYPALLDSEGVPQGFRSRKQLAVLVYLALEGCRHPVSRELLTELLWADVSLRQGRHSLSQALSAIRNRLGGESLSRERSTVRLLQPPTTDLDFLTGTLEGQPTDLDHPLQGLELAAGAAFGQWVEGARGRCLSTARRSLAGRLRGARSSGDTSRVHEYAAELYRVDPLSETAVCALAEQLLLHGDFTGTHKLLRSHLDRARHVGKAKSPAIDRILRRVEAGLDRPPGGELLTSESLSRERAEIFVGRDAELARMEKLWEDARRGRLVTCLVTGDAGIGKSSLLRRFSAVVAARAAAVWEISCQGIGKNIPFAAISDLIHAATRDSAVTSTAPEWLAEASRVCPGLREVYTGIPDPPPAPAESVRLRVAEALVRMQAAAADEGPMLLVVDDLGNLDAASRDVLFVTLRRLIASPMLVVGATRTPEGRCLVSEESAGPIGMDWDDRFVLNPMSPSEAQELTNAFCQESDRFESVDTVTLLALAGGNPHLIVTLLRDFLESGNNSLLAAHSAGRVSPSDWHPPEMMRRVFEREFGGLNATSAEMLNVLAVAGRTLPVADLNAVLGLSRVESDRAVLALLQRQIARTDSGTLSFRSDLHRDFVYGAMPREARKFYHAQIAHQLLSIIGDQEFQRPLEASHHFLKASMLGNAVDAALIGVEPAMAEGAASEAELALQAVLQAGPTTRVDTTRFLLARALSTQGKHRQAMNALDSVDPASLNPEERIIAAILRAESLHRGRLDDDEIIRQAVHDALALAFQAATPLYRLRALQINAEMASESGDQSTLALVDEAAKRIRAGCVNPRVKAMATLSNAYCLLTSGQTAVAAGEFERCIPPLRVGGCDSDLRRALNGNAICQLSAGCFREALLSLREAAEVAEQFGDADGAANSLSNLGSVHEDLGEFQLAAECYERAAMAAQTVANPRRLTEIAINLTGFALQLRLTEQAQLFSDWADSFSRHANQRRLQVDVLNVKADCELAKGNAEAALSLLKQVGSTSRDRLYLLGDMGRHERLRRFRVWYTGGRDALRTLVINEDLESRCPQIADQLEVRLFEEWALNESSRGPGTAFAQVSLHGLYGIVERLASVGVRFDTAAHESGRAIAVRDAQPSPNCLLVGLEAAVAKCLSLSVRLRYDKKSPPMRDQTAFLNNA